MARQNAVEASTTEGTVIGVPVPTPDADLFRYKSTDDILQLLLDNPYEQFSIRQLARLTDNATQSVKRAVDVLETNGMVVVDTAGNSRLVGINRARVSSPDDPVLRIPQPEFHPPVREALDRLRDELEGVQGVLVFGSVASGRADRQSDIDIWVLAGDRSQQHRANELVKRLGRERFDGDRYEFQILVETPESARGQLERLQNVFTDAITLVESEDLRELKAEVLGDA